MSLFNETVSGICCNHFRKAQAMDEVMDYGYFRTANHWDGKFAKNLIVEFVPSPRYNTASQNRGNLSVSRHTQQNSIVVVHIVERNSSESISTWLLDY